MTESSGATPNSGGRRVVFAGTGGQGVLTAARLLTTFFSQRGHQVVSGQLHGMAQRGGSVQASVMIDCGISPVIPAGTADSVIGFEPIETVRALPLMSANTTVFMNVTPVVPYVLAQAVVRGRDGAYPDGDMLQQQIRSVTTKLHAFDATELARRAGLVRTLNIVMVGCLFGSGVLPADPEDFVVTMMQTTTSKLADANEAAFWLGVEHGENLHESEGGS